MHALLLFSRDNEWEEDPMEEVFGRNFVGGVAAKLMGGSPR